MCVRRMDAQAGMMLLQQAQQQQPTQGGSPVTNPTDSDGQLAPPAPADLETTDAWKLFVGQVPRAMRHEDLTAQFAQFGELEELFIIRDQVTGMSKGCCFVRFKTRQAAEACLEALNDKVTLQGASNPLQVSFAAQHHNAAARQNGAGNDNETKLFVGQIPSAYREVELSAMFEPYGVVKEVYIMRHRETGLSKGAGFVRLEADHTNIKRAIAELNGKQLEGATGPMKVDVAHQKTPLSPRAAMAQSMMTAMANPVLAHRGYAMQPGVIAYSQAGWYAAPATAPPDDRKNSNNPTKLFVGGLTPATTENQLLEIFAHYGHVREVVILRYPNGQSKSSGFVKYSTPEEAEIAVAAMSQRYYLPQSTRPMSVRWAGSSNNPPEHKLFVGHLPATFDEIQTTELFRQFGEVVEVHVMRDVRGMNKGSAFVKFADRLAAENAIAHLNGNFVVGGDKPLRVSFAFSKSAPGQATSLMMPAGMMQQISPTSSQQRNGMMVDGNSPSQAPTTPDHMSLQQPYGTAYAFYPHMSPYYPDGSQQLPMTLI